MRAEPETRDSGASDPWTSWPSAFREAFCARRIFRAFGVPYSDVYVLPRTVNPATGAAEVGVMARRGGRQFVVTVGALDVPEAEFRERWIAAATEAKRMSIDDFNRMTDATRLRSRAVEIFVAMRERGFEGPVRPSID